MENIFLFFPMFANGMVALAFLFKLHKRSISAFTIFIALAVSSNLAYYGNIEYGVLIMIIAMVLIMVRAMARCDTDTFLKPIHKRRRRTDVTSKYI